MAKQCETLQLTLPIPTSANKMLTKYGGNLGRSKAYTRFREEVGWIARAAGALPHEGRIAVIIRVYRKAKRGDLDNYLKPLLDSLNGIAWIDDKQITEIHAYRYDEKENPRAEIDIVYLGKKAWWKRLWLKIAEVA